MWCDLYDDPIIWLSSLFSRDNCQGLWQCKCFIQVPFLDSSRAMGDLIAEPVCIIMGWSSLTCHEGDRATPSQHRFHWLLNPGFVCAYWAIQLWFLVLRQHMTQGTFSEHEWLYVSLMHWPDETEQGPTWLEPEGWSLRFPEHSLQQIRGELHTLQSPSQFCL